MLLIWGLTTGPYEATAATASRVVGDESVCVTSLVTGRRSAHMVQPRVALGSVLACPGGGVMVGAVLAIGGGGRNPVGVACAC